MPREGELQRVSKPLMPNPNEQNQGRFRRQVAVGMKQMLEDITNLRQRIEVLETWRDEQERS